MAGGKVNRELALLVTGKDVSATKTLRGVNKELNKLGTIAARGGANVARNLERAVVAGGAAAIGALGYAIKAAQDFESATTGVAKTVDGDISAIVTGLKQMSATAPLAYEELAGIAETAGALGVAKGDILAFTDTVSKLAVTSDLTSEAASTALGHLKTNLNLTGDAFEHVGNTVVDLGNKGASTESQIIGMAEGVSGVANIVGLSTPQVLGWGAAWANTGEEVEAGSTEMQKFFLGTFEAVNKGGAGLKTLAKVAGVSSKQFAAAYRKDASGTLADFLKKLGKLSKVEQASTLEKLGFTDQRITRGLLKILGNTDNLTDSLSIATTAWQDNNAMQIEAEKRFKTSASQMAILKNNVRLAAATIGTELLPVVNELAKEGVDWLQGHQAETEQFAKDLAAGIRDAVTWAKSLDWDAIGNALKSGAGFAASLVEAFAGAPTWVQQFLAGGFVANKFTGGAVGSIIGELGKGLIKGVLGMNAGVVNINAASVNGGVGGAAAGSGGLGAAARGVVGYLGIVGLTVAAGQMIADAIGATPANPTSGSSRAHYRDENPAKGTGSFHEAAQAGKGGLSPDERQAFNDQRKALDKVYDGLEKNRLDIVSKLGSTAEYQARQMAFAIRDLPAPVVNVSTTVVSNITVRETVRQQKVSLKYGRVAS